jgi:hypothetical protein
LLASLALYSTVLPRFGPYLDRFGPKSDPSFVPMIRDHGCATARTSRDPMRNTPPIWRTVSSRNAGIAGDRCSKIFNRAKSFEASLPAPESATEQRLHSRGMPMQLG